MASDSCVYSAILLEAYKEHRGFVRSEKKKSLEQIAVYKKKLAVATISKAEEDEKTKEMNAEFVEKLKEYEEE